MTRKFSSISVQTTLATGISNTALTVPVAVGTGSTLMGGVSLAGGNVDQYSILMDPDTASAEIMWVTGVSGDNLTVLRGKDGTSAIAHNSGAVIKHVLTGGDLIYLVDAAAPTADLANTGLPFPGSTSGTNTLKAPAVTGTVTNTLPATTGTLMSAESVDAATSKATPVDADEMPLSDSAASFGIKKLTWANIKATLFTAIGALTGKTTPVGADTFAISDSAAAGVGKSVTWTNILATIQALTDTLYAKFKGPAVNTQTASYVLVASDVGKRVVMNSASATTITVNTSLFGAADTLEILNIGAGVCTITAGTATVSTAGTLALVQNAGGKLYFTSAGVSVFIPSAVGASSSGLTKITSASFSAVANTGTTFDGVFTSAYKKYLVVISEAIASASGSVVSIQTRVAGVTTSANYYGVASVLDYSGATTNQLSNAAASCSIGKWSNGNSSTLKLIFAQVGNGSQKPNFSGIGIGGFDGGPIKVAGEILTAEVTDGFILTPASGTITGTVTVYGLAN